MNLGDLVSLGEHSGMSFLIAVAYDGYSSAATGVEDDLAAA